MDERSSDFRDALVELIDRSPAPGDHPAADQWIAYHRGQLSEEEEARLQEHLARCRGCFELAEAAAAFAQPDEEPGAGQEVETAALWRLLRQRLGLSPDNVRAISAAAPPRPARKARLPPYALAASLFAALVGLAAWNLHQRNLLQALRAPRPNAPIFDVAAGERLPIGQELALPAGPRMLVFHPAEERPVYRLVIRDAAAGRELWSAELRPDEDLALTLYLPEGLRPGRYRLELADGSGGRLGRVLEAHLLRVTEADRGE